MNTSMHDGLNLAWKLNLVIRGIAKPDLLTTYAQERGKIAQDLIDFDRGHVKAYSDGAAALEQNFLENIRFLSGVGVEYAENILNSAGKANGIALYPGSLLTPARVTRYIDTNPVDIQLDIPWLCQFRLYFLVPDFKRSQSFLNDVCCQISGEHVLARSAQQAKASYLRFPRPLTDYEQIIQPQRYLAVSEFITYALVTRTSMTQVEIEDLPPLLQSSRWTFYLDNLKDPGGQDCIDRWVGNMDVEEVVILSVRPDGYVGSVQRWSVTGIDAAKNASRWLDEYFAGFLE